MGRTVDDSAALEVTVALVCDDVGVSVVVSEKLGLRETELFKLRVVDDEAEGDADLELLAVLLLVCDSVAETDTVVPGDTDIDAVWLRVVLGESDIVVEVVGDPVRVAVPNPDSEGDLLLLPDNDKLRVPE